MNPNDIGGRKPLDTTDTNRGRDQLRTDGGQRKAIDLLEGFTPSTVADGLLDLVHGAEAGLLDDELQAISAAQTLLEELGESQARFELYQDNADEWRWRLRHSNTNIIADSGEGYASKQKAQQGIGSVVANALGADVVEFDPGEEP